MLMLLVLGGRRLVLRGLRVRQGGGGGHHRVAPQTAQIDRVHAIEAIADGGETAVDLERLGLLEQDRVARHACGIGGLELTTGVLPNVHLLVFIVSVVVVVELLGLVLVEALAA